MSQATFPSSHPRPASAVRFKSRDARRMKDKAFVAVCIVAAAMSLVVLAVLLTSILVQGIGHLDWQFIRGIPSRDADQAGIWPPIIGTLITCLVCALTAIPIGIATAILLEEYKPKNRYLAKAHAFIQLNITNLAGVPSVVYGILGLTVFVEALQGITGGRTVISAGVTISVLVLPIVIITSAEAIRAVPRALREGAFGLGATRWEVIRTQVLPYAAPGILTGTVLSLARALGEAAPLLLVGAVGERLADGYGFLDPAQLRSPFTALPIAITDWTKRPLGSGFFELSAAAIVVMLTIVLVANSVAIVLRNRFERRRG